MQNSKESDSQQNRYSSLKWYSLAIFCLIQIVISADNGILNNAVSSLVESFHTTINSVQLANSIYPLVAGSFMIAGGLLGLIIGWKKLLQIGIITFAIAEIIAFLSPNIFIFTYVARILAGIGGSLAIPAVLGLIPATFKGKEVAIGFGAIAASTGIASAIGPIAGGYVIDNYGWRIVFALLAGLFALLLVGSFWILKDSAETTKPKFDFIGVMFFAFSMIMITFGLLNISTWGIWKAMTDTFQLAGISLSPILIGIGILVLVIFFWWESQLEKTRKIVLFPSTFLKSKQVRAGLIFTAVIFFVTGGVGFVNVSYLQIALGYNAVHSGLLGMILAVGMIIFSIGAPALLKKPNPQRLIQIGLVFNAIGALLISYGLGTSTISWIYYVGLFILGSGLGLLGSMSGVIVTSAIPLNFAKQSGGVQGTMRNLGQAFGIALLGVVLLMSITNVDKKDIIKDSATDATEKHLAQTADSIPLISNKQLIDYLDKKEITGQQQSDIVSINAKSRADGVKKAFMVLVATMILLLLATGDIPKTIKE